MSEPTKTRKVHLLVEAEVDEAEGLTDQDHARVAAVVLNGQLARGSDDYSRERGVVFMLDDGDVSYRKPNPPLGTYEVIEEDGGVYLDRH